LVYVHFHSLLVSLATFGVYAQAGNHLDVAQALASLALFDILRFPLFMLPQIINRIVEASISFERVREFLLAEEHHPVGGRERWLRMARSISIMVHLFMIRRSQTWSRREVLMGELVPRRRRVAFVV